MVFDSFDGGFYWFGMIEKGHSTVSCRLGRHILASRLDGSVGLVSAVAGRSLSSKEVQRPRRK